MSLALRFTPEASADLEETKRWYDDRRQGLGDDFVLCVEEAWAKICRNPEIYPIVYRDVRYSCLRRFPYGVFYRIMTKEIWVIGVFHGRRDPKSWQSRA